MPEFTLAKKLTGTGSDSQHSHKNPAGAMHENIWRVNQTLFLHFNPRYLYGSEEINIDIFPSDNGDGHQTLKSSYEKFDTLNVILASVLDCKETKKDFWVSTWKKGEMKHGLRLISKFLKIKLFDGKDEGKFITSFFKIFDDLCIDQTVTEIFFEENLRLIGLGKFLEVTLEIISKIDLVGYGTGLGE